jgi:hypothetical protein
MSSVNIAHYFNSLNSISLSTPQFSCKKKEESPLSIVKYENNAKPAFKIDNYWDHYCRGLIVDLVSEKILCVPTPKSIDNVHLKDILFSQYDKCAEDSLNVTVEPLLDGTMINLYYNEEWCHSTRSVIGAECRWSSQKTFKAMFQEILGEHILDFYDTLSKDTCYTFLIRHSDNRIISPIVTNSLYLIDAHRIDRDTKSIYKVNIHDMEVHKAYDCIPPINKFVCAFGKDDLYERIQTAVKNCENSYDKYTQGVCVRVNEFRFNYKNDDYGRIKSYKGNSANPLFTYVDQRYKGILPDFLKHFPEKLKEYSRYRDKIHIMTQELYDFYCSTFKQKTTSLKEDVPYQLKPLCYELHGLYLQDKKPVHFKMVQEFVNKMPPARLYFVLKYYFTYTKPEGTTTHIHYGEAEEGEILEEP